MERNERRFAIRYTPRENPDAPRLLRLERLVCPFFKPEIPIELHPVPGGIAEKAGVRSGDKLVAVNGGHIPSRAQYFLALSFSRGEPNVTVVDVYPPSSSQVSIEVKTKTVEPIILERSG